MLMKTLKTLFLAGLALFAMSSFAWSGSTAPPGIETHLFPALYKTAKGPVQKVRVTVKHEPPPMQRLPWAISPGK